MVRELERKRQSAKFPETAPAANPVFFRTYSRRNPAGLKETWDEVCDRILVGLVKLGKLSHEEAAILDKMQHQMKALPSGRWLWVGGTDWIAKPKNFSGAYNCTSTNLQDWKAFGLMMDLAMRGCGTGATIEPRYINQLPPIRNLLNINVQGEISATPKEQLREYTEISIKGNQVTIHVGDSRESWVESYQTLLELSTDERFSGELQVFVDISDIRQARETVMLINNQSQPESLRNHQADSKLDKLEGCEQKMRQESPSNIQSHSQSKPLETQRTTVGESLNTKVLKPISKKNSWLWQFRQKCRFWHPIVAVIATIIGILIQLLM